MSRPFGLSVAAVVAVLIVSGCGGSGELSERQLRTRATRACSLATRQSDRIATPRTPAGGAAFVSKGIAVLEPEYRQLRALRPPSDLKQVYDISLTAFSHKLESMRSALTHLRHGGDPVILMKTLQQRLAPLDSSEDGAWQALEIPACLTR